MKLVSAKTALASVILLTLGLFSTINGESLNSQNDPEAYLRIEPGPVFYIEVYMHQPLEAGRDVSAIRASLRDTDHKKLLSTTVVASPEGDSNFRIVIPESEAAIVAHFEHYVVLVDVYPAAGGPVDVQMMVGLEVSWELRSDPQCPRPELLQVNVTRNSNHAYAVNRMEEIRTKLDEPNAKSHISAQVKQDGNVAARTVRSFGPARVMRDANGIKELFPCISFNEVPPAGDSELQVQFDPTMPLELRSQRTFALSSATSPQATNEERDARDFFDLGATLTSSVTDETQDDGSVLRNRTTRGALDLWFAPVLNKRTVGTRGVDGGWVQVWTPFYIDAKVATGKITADTLALNTINLGSRYEFRQYPDTAAYSDLFRHMLTFEHTSDRDFKQDEFKFAYEFQPIFGRINRPLGSAPNLLRGEVVPNDKDRFGSEIIPVVGVEVGRTYRVRDPKEFEGVSRNLRRFYFGADMVFELTKFVRVELSDRFYVNGEDRDNKTRNYFLGGVEVPLPVFESSRTRAHHALFLTFERGDQPPFTNPSVNVLKFSYRIRARGIFNR